MVCKAELLAKSGRQLIGSDISPYRSLSQAEIVGGILRSQQLFGSAI